MFSSQDLPTSYYRARYYDPSAGRFLSEDPIEFYGGKNFYVYVGDNSPNYLDPLGLMNVSYNVTFHDDGWYGLMTGTTNWHLPPRVSINCECTGNGKYKLTIDVKWSIYVDASKGWQWRHEQGHIDIFENFMNSRKSSYEQKYEKTYDSEAACKKAAAKQLNQVMDDLNKDYRDQLPLQDAHDHAFQHAWEWFKNLF